MVTSNCGKAFSKAISRCRPGLLADRSWLMSVLTEKCVAVYQTEAIARRIAPALTHQG